MITLYEVSSSWKYIFSSFLILSAKVWLKSGHLLIFFLIKSRRLTFMWYIILHRLFLNDSFAQLIWPSVETLKQPNETISLKRSATSIFSNLRKDIFNSKTKTNGLDL